MLLLVPHSPPPPLSSLFSLQDRGPHIHTATRTEGRHMVRTSAHTKLLLSSVHFCTNTCSQTLDLLRKVFYYDLWMKGALKDKGGGCVCVGGAYFGSPSGSLLFMFLKTWNVLVERWISECFLRSKTKRCTPKKSDEDFQPFLWNFLLLKVKDVLFMGCWARVTLEKSGINCFVNEGRHAASCGEAGSWKWHCLYSEYQVVVVWGGGGVPSPQCPSPEHISVTSRTFGCSPLHGYKCNIFPKIWTQVL